MHDRSVVCGWISSTSNITRKAESSTSPLLTTFFLIPLKARRIFWCVDHFFFPSYLFLHIRNIRVKVTKETFRKYRLLQFRELISISQMLLWKVEMPTKTSMKHLHMSVMRSRNDTNTLLSCPEFRWQCPSVTTGYFSQIPPITFIF